jgi:hypothetical protein
MLHRKDHFFKKLLMVAEIINAGSVAMVVRKRPYYFKLISLLFFAYFQGSKNGTK